MTKKHLPRKNTQINRIRSLLLNINDNVEVTHVDYNISTEEFNAYFDALENSGYIQLIENSEKYKVSSYIIVDIHKFEKLISNAYKHIDKIIIPIVTTILEVALTIATKTN